VRTKRRAPFLVIAASLFLSLTGTKARAEDILRGPHPFVKENSLSLSGGLTAASGAAVGGTRLHLNYGYQLAGSVWLDIHAGIVDGDPDPPGAAVCASCGTSADVLGGIAYRLRMNIPVVPYAKLSAGVVYLFPGQGENTAGLLARPAVGGKYFLYDWLGFGLELATGIGFVSAGSSRTVASLDLSVGAEWQF